MIGIIKYPKLASITRSVETAYIQTAQFVKIKIPEKKSVINLNYTYIVFGKNKAYKEKYKILLVSMSKSFKKFN